ncbi:2-phosphosulfolactate phosphatase [Carboxylicivirga linearis]|uniref:Probable 2-phosphosulfolactate phosphatase n=1 Tax=Carboxylicivirga linearis TaxID=1628157 RepID=A0ABS5JY04_9BACT|nr:2-phosphosulfolactate phosphatase [Carboxylicivirga linearis]MBS2099758.1 2-phosphosulfolactate phosphatase [Carboxylicivirga linearis]
MKIDVINTAQEVTSKKVKGKTSVVIDILRATSVMTTAIQNNATQIIPVLTPEDAFQIKSKKGNNTILGGERNAELIEGFDYGNSPLSYTKEVIENKCLIITTTNGTLAIKNAVESDELFIASFLNAQATVNQLINSNDIVLICSGNNGVYTLEDNLCAGFIISLLNAKLENVDLTDSAIASLSLYQSTKTNVVKLASKGYHYNVLKSKQFDDDLTECFTPNKYDVVLKWNGESIIKAV